MEQPWKKEYMHTTLYDAVTTSDWDLARRYLDEHRDALSAPLGWEGTALHVAVLSKEFDIARELINMMSDKELEIYNERGYTALHLVAKLGIKSKTLANMMVEKNPNLITFVDIEDMLLPVAMASNLDNNHDMTLHLYKLTPLEIFDRKDYLGVELIRICIHSGYLDIALDLVKRFPKLTVSKYERTTILGPLSSKASYFRSGNQFVFWQQWIYSLMHVPSFMAFPNLHEDEGIAYQRGNKANALNRFHEVFWNLLNVFGADDIYRIKAKHVLAFGILDVFIREISKLTHLECENLNAFSSLITATKNGNIEIVEAIIKVRPRLLIVADDQGVNPFMHAIIHRQGKILGLMCQFREYRNWVSGAVDNRNNTWLHKTGELAPTYQLERVSGAALQFQREIQWFKEVEKLVPTSSHFNENADGKVAHQLFVEKHLELKKEGEKWLKEVATSNTVVAALITTIMFSAIYTLPGGNNENTGIPIFARRSCFIVFVISDAFSLFSSITSLLIFLGILTSRFAEEDFLEFLPRKLILGLSSLFLSLASMMLAFGCTINIILTYQIPWTFTPIMLLSGVPIATFVMLQSPLLFRIYNSTYGPSIIGRTK